MLQEETIAAVITPAGEGAVAGIRISGPLALEVGRKIFSGPVESYLSHTAHHGKIVSQTGETLDTVVLLVMKAPRSYTGEDTIEIFCHGGSLIKERVLKRIFEAGARPARPGEFSLRAFLNGKLDLAQAEAVQHLIAAKNEQALEAASRQLEGALSEKVASFQKQLTEMAAIVEASVDFPEEGLEFATPEEIIKGLEKLCTEMSQLQNTFHEGRFLHEGISLCLVGSPNVGKSSLMNALLGKDRAIVTDIAGTTRDLLEEDLRFGGLSFRLIDTAGIRQTDEAIEQEGIRRSARAMNEADLILLVLDASRPLAFEDLQLIEKAPPQKTLFVWNKVDLGTPRKMFEPQVSVAAKHRQGLEGLQKAIEQKIFKQGSFSKDEIVLTQLRHYKALTQAIEACKTALHALKQTASPEFVTSDLRAALGELGTILGTNVAEDILSAIFSKFCLGK